MAKSRKGLDKVKPDAPSDILNIKEGVEEGYVYIVDYLINNLIESKSPISFASNHKQRTIDFLKKKYPKVKITSILIKNPRKPSKQHS